MPWLRRVLGVQDLGGDVEGGGEDGAAEDVRGFDR